MNIFDHINKQAALGTLLVVIFLAGLFFYTIGGDTAPSSGVSEADGASLDATLGKDLLLALARLKSTKLDTAIFADPIFTTLHDWGVVIAPQPVGRRNPFAEFEGGAPAGKSAGGNAAGAALPKKGGVASPPSSPAKPPVGSGFDLQ